MLPKDPAEEDRVDSGLRHNIDKQYGPLNFWIGITVILVVGFLISTVLIILS